MISNQATAAEISKLMLDLFQQIDKSVSVVLTSCPQEEAHAYRRAAGHILGEILEILNPLYGQHPSLKPKDWD